MVRVDTREATRAIRTFGLAAQDIDKATARAMNHTIGVVRTRSIRAITSEYNVKAGRVRKALKIWRANRNHLHARIDSELRPLTIGRFKAKQRPEGVQVEIRRGKKQMVKSAFKVKKIPGQVFARGQYSSGSLQWRKKRRVKRGPDMPITPVLTTSVAGMFTAPSVVLEMTREANQRLPARVAHEIDRIIQSRSR